MNKFNYKNLTPFKWFVLENFPFIEADFDALTEWQLFCKLGKEINKIIDSGNALGTQMETITNAFINLQNYVNNYLENIDVQEEVNKKLNEMVSDGTLSQLINQNLINNLNKTTGISIHISFDDCEKCFQNLINNIYNSLFDEPFFNMLKDLHDKYNACFSLYVFTDTFNNIASTKYQREFQENSTWLKFGYHALNGGDNLNGVSYQSFNDRYNNFVKNCVRITGTNKIIDRVPRLANYVGSIHCINGGSDADCGLIGLLDADDDRISYIHSKLTKNWVDTQYEYFDNITNLYFIKTNLRIESSNNLNSDLNNILKTTKSTNRNIEIFSHEWYFYNGTTITNKNKIELCCQFAQNNNIPFNFVENKLPNMVGKFLNQDNTLGLIQREGSNLIFSQFLPAYRNTTLGKLQRYITGSDKGTIVLGSSNKNYGLFGYLVKVDNILKIHNNMNNIQCSIYEYNGRTGFTAKTANGYGFDSWIDIKPSGITEIPLQEDTKFIGIVFRTTGETPLTDNDILINTYAAFM